MPIRTVPLVTNQVYHVLNRGINQQPIFLDMRDYQRAREIVRFYTFITPNIRFSRFLTLPTREKTRVGQEWREKNKKIVEFLAFVLMPNHFHFLVEQKEDGGISKFMSLFQNSYTRYFNTRHQKIGPILQGQFKAVRTENDDQLLHLSRYIHLNPYSSFIVKNLADLQNYPWSSLSDYLNKTEDGFCQKEIVFSNFKNREDYQIFVFDHANYQRRLEKIKHLLLEK